MTSHSGDSFLGEEDVRGTPSSRSHTALGIYHSSNSSSRKNSFCSPTTSPPVVRAATTSPNVDRRLDPSSPRSRRLSTDEAYESQDLTDDRGHENTNINDLESLQEDSCTDGDDKDGHKGKNLSGFLKKFRSSKRTKQRGQGSGKNTSDGGNGTL